MGSTRLPGKSLLPLAGEPLVGRLLERVKRAKLIDHIVLAVPDTPENYVLRDLGYKHGVYVYAGSENNLVDRYYFAAKNLDTNYVVRIPADNPTPEPDEIDRIITHHISLQRPGFSSNLSSFYNQYPDGIGAEIFDFSLLEDIRIKNLSPRLREHVHLNFFDYQTNTPVNDSWCPVSTVKCPTGFQRPSLVLDVNTYSQYIFMSKIYDYLYPRNPFFHISDIIQWYDNIYIPSSVDTSLL